MRMQNYQNQPSNVLPSYGQASRVLQENKFEVNRQGPHLAPALQEDQFIHINLRSSFAANS